MIYIAGPADPAVIHLAATTGDIPSQFTSNCLGEYRVHTLIQSHFKPCTNVYKQMWGEDSRNGSISSRYLYRTDIAWYCSGMIGKEDGNGVYLRNMSKGDQVPGDGWEWKTPRYYSHPPNWIPVHSLRVRSSHLPQCGVITVHGVGVADGEYEVVPDQYSMGRHVYRQAVEPYCTLRVWYGYGWCVTNGDTSCMVMHSMYPSMCPADPLCGYGDGVGGCVWKKDRWTSSSGREIVVPVQCSVHRF